jgi:ATP-binding cassette subfamily F protein uup
MMAQRKGCAPLKAVTVKAEGSQAPAPSATPAAAASPSAPRKLSYKDKHALETLPSAIAKLEAEIGKLSAKLAEANLYARDRVAFDKATADLAKAHAALDAAETQWLELEELRALIEG